MNKRAYFRKYITKADAKQGKFYPSPLQAVRAHTVINECIFGGKLTRPRIIIQRLDDAWGICHGDLDKSSSANSKCTLISLNYSFYSWRHFVEVLAHEMVHQYQIEHLNRVDHGKTFWAWKEKFERYNMRLRIAYGQPRKAKFLK